MTAALTAPDFAAAFKVVTAAEETARRRKKSLAVPTVLRRELEAAFTTWATEQTVAS